MDIELNVYKTLSVGEMAFLMSSSEDNVLNKIQKGEIDFGIESDGELRFDKKQALKYFKKVNEDSILGW